MLFSHMGLLFALAPFSLYATSICEAVDGSHCAARPAKDHALLQTSSLDVSKGECSRRCSGAFIKCFKSRSRKAGIDGGYKSCRALLDGQTGGVAKKCKGEAGCADSAAMTALKTGARPRPRPRDPRPAPSPRPVPTPRPGAGGKSVAIEQKWTVDGATVTKQRLVGGPQIQGAGGLVVIDLHGHGDKGGSKPGKTIRDVCWFSPWGEEKSWNVGGETSQAPDVEFISRIVDIAEATEGCDVSKGVVVIGNSNGCAMIHRLLIESHDTRLKKFMCSVTQLTTNQYKNGQFQKRVSDSSCKPSCTNADTMPVTEPVTTGRILFNYLGAKDKLCPARGGRSKVSGGVTFLSGEDSIAVWKEALGDKNAKLVVDPDANHSKNTRGKRYDPMLKELLAMPLPA